jgi:hypothetical protein
MVHHLTVAASKEIKISVYLHFVKSKQNMAFALGKISFPIIIHLY